MKRSGLILSFVFLSLTTSNATAQDAVTTLNRAYLKGLRSVTVLVDYRRGEKDLAERLRVEIELRLREAGIQVKPSSAVLILGRRQAEIQEFGYFERKDGLRNLPATTWESKVPGQSRSNWAHDWPTARDNMLRAVDQFLNDWLAVNQHGVTAHRAGGNGGQLPFQLHNAL